MTLVCPCCRRALPSAEELIDAKVRELIEYCEAKSITITWDGFVRDIDVAEHFLRIEPGTLRNRRYGARPLPLRRAGRHDEYALTTVAVELIELADAEERSGLHGSALSITSEL